MLWTRRDFRALELAIGDDFSNFCHLGLGGSRGLSVKLTESQASEWEDIRSRLRVEDSSSDNNSAPMDTEIETDIFSCKHCILYHSNLVLSGQSTGDVATNVHMFLLNDFCLITTCKDSSGKEQAEEFVIKHALPLDEVTFAQILISKSLAHNVVPTFDELAFRLVHNNIYYTLTAGSREEKNRWIEELRLAIFSIYVQAPEEPTIGWPFFVENSTYLAAAFFGNDNMFSYYLNEDESLVNTTFSCGMCALHWAALNDSRSIVKTLLGKYGANVNIVNNANNTALHLAAAKGHTAVVQILLDHQASIHAKNDSGLDPLSMALFYCEREKDMEILVKLFYLKGADLNASSVHKNSSRIHDCALNNLSTAIDVLVGAGADVNRKHKETELNPLQIACGNVVPHPTTIQALISNGSLVNILDSKGRSLVEILLDQYNINLGEQVLSISTDLLEISQMSEDFESEQIRDVTTEAIRIVVIGGSRLNNTEDKKFATIIQNAIRETKAEEIPEYFEEYSLTRNLCLKKDEWMLDESASNCLLCQVTFTISCRRHHCRACGTLCCALCTSRKLPLGCKVYSSSNRSRPSTPTTESKERSDGLNLLERVCDPCYQKILHDAKRFDEKRMDRCRLITSPAITSTLLSSTKDYQDSPRQHEESFLVDANEEDIPDKTIITQQALERLNLENWREAINKTPVTDAES